MDSVCRKCFHACVCEEFNADRDYPHKRCAYANDHFIDADRLRELAAADRDGRVVVLPCKVGDMVYEIAKGLSIYQSGLHLYVYENTVTARKLFEWVLGNEFGKTVFLTRAEAEAALKEQEKQKCLSD